MSGKSEYNRNFKDIYVAPKTRILAFSGKSSEINDLRFTDSTDITRIH
jgi:hypothetical protein